MPGRCHLDEDGFFVLVDREAYQSFVALDWTLDVLDAHIARQRAAGRIAVVFLGQEHADAPVDILAEPSARPSTRELRSALVVGDGGSWVTDYTDLTMAAQYDDEPVVPRPQEATHVLLPAGRYAVTIRRLREEAGRDTGLTEPSLEVVLGRARPGDADPGGRGIAWLEG